MRPAPRNVEDGRDLRLVEAVPDAQLDDLVLLRLQFGEGLTDQPSYFGLLGAAPGIGGLADLVGCLVEARSGHTHPAVAFLPRRGVKPDAQLAGVPQVAQLVSREGEGLEQGLGGGRGLAQDPAAIAVQACRVRVVRGRQPGRVARLDGGDHLAVVHVHTVVELPALSLFVAIDDK